MLSDFKRFAVLAPVTAVIMMIALLVTLVSLFGRNTAVVELLIFDQSKIVSGQFWRLITPIFLHFSAFGVFFLHLAFNLLLFWLFAKPIELQLGSRFLLTFVIVTGIISNTTEALFSAVPFGGLSGVVYALLGFLWVLPMLEPYRYPRLRIPSNIAYFLIVVMLISALGLLGNNIANAAHLSGFFSGILIAVGFVYWQRLVKR